MVLRKRKGETGAATAYVSRTKALKLLQIKLQDFRRLCILKGIYPVPPRHPEKVANGKSNVTSTFYLLKDIQFMMHEDIIKKIRDFKVYARKLTKAKDKGYTDRVQMLKLNKPQYRLDHILKERFPTFIDAVRDMDDCLNLIFLFATFPQSKIINVKRVIQCKKLSVQFMLWVIQAKALRKVYITIKGFYFQAEIKGEKVLWLIPLPTGFAHEDADYKTMSTFTEFYVTMLKFVNNQLYKDIGVNYPPKLKLEAEDEKYAEMCSKAEIRQERLGSLVEPLIGEGEGEAEDDVVEYDVIDDGENPERWEKAKQEQQKVQAQKKLFAGQKFFLNREVPREVFTFVIRAAGGRVSWDETCGIGSTYKVNDPSITYHVMEKPVTKKQRKEFPERYLVAAQWVFDSFNAGKLLPVKDYAPASDELPPHLSPFVEVGEGDYDPTETTTEAEEEMEEGVDMGDEAVEESDDDEDEENEDEESEAESEVDDDAEGEEDSEDDNLEKEYEQKSKRRKLDEVQETQPKASKKKDVLKKMASTQGQLTKVDGEAEQKKLEREQLKLAEMSIPKKHKRLYSKIKFGQKRKEKEVNELKAKKIKIMEEQKQKKKQNIVEEPKQKKKRGKKGKN